MMKEMIQLFNEIKSKNLNSARLILSSNPELVNAYLYGVTPLLYSIECDHEQLAIELCKLSKIDLTLTDNDDCTCLEKAIEKNFLSLVELICKSNRDMYLNDLLSNDETYLTNSIKLGNDQITIALLNGGCDPNVPNKLKEYPLQLAVKHNKIEVLRAMLNSSNLKSVNKLANGYCSLLEACETDMSEISLLLIEHGADLNIRYKSEDFTPLMHAVVNRNEFLVGKLTESRNCDVNLVDADGNSALHLAVYEENEVVIKKLLNSNANKHAKNKQGQTPLAIAKELDNDELINILS